MTKFKVTGFIYTNDTMVGEAVNYILDTFQVSQVNRIEKREEEFSVGFTFFFIAESKEDVELYAMEPMQNKFDVDNYAITES